MPAGVQPEELRHAAINIVSELSGVAPVSSERMRRGVMNINYRVETAGSPGFIVRFYPPDNATVVNYEPDLVQRIADVGLPVARVIGDSRSGPVGPLAYMVYEFLPGVALRAQISSMGPRARRRLADELVDVLATLNTLNVQGHGDLVSARNARYGSWMDFVGTAFSQGIAAARRHRSLPEQLIKDLSLVQDGLDRFEPPKTCGVAWGDLTPGNVLVDQHNALVGLIDFEGSVGGEVALSLGFARAAGGQLSRDMLLAWTTSNAVDVDRVDLYAVLRGARLARFANTALPAGRRRRSVDRVFPGFGSAARRLAVREM